MKQAEMKRATAGNNARYESVAGFCHSSSAPLDSKKRARIPKGFQPKAQGCEERATLGGGREPRSNPERVAASRRSEWNTATTLSGLPRASGPFPRVARSSQPWAGGLNPFGIGNVSQMQKGRRTPRRSAVWRNRATMAKRLDRASRGAFYRIANSCNSLPAKL